MDSSTYHKLMPKSHKPYRISGMQQNTIMIYANGVPNTILIHQAATAPSSNMNAGIGDGKDAIEDKKENFNN